jgi:CheY-like chemotaxis protein
MPRVLVVDDSPIDRVLVEGILHKDPRMSVRTAPGGSDALALLADWTPDVVVTDLQMPEMDGLELVTAIRIHFPRIPVVLITAHGSEDLAVRALEQGAASYVAKSQLAQQLPAVVDQVVELALENRGYEALTHAMEYAEFRFCATNDFATTDRLVELAQQLAASLGVCDTGGQVRLGMALEEAFRTAILRGNLELTPDLLMALAGPHDRADAWLAERRNEPRYRDRRLSVHLRVTSAEIRIEIVHDGPALAAPTERATASPALEDPADRSIILMKAFMDEVSFGMNGQSIILVKHKSP